MKSCGIVIRYIDWRKVKKWFFNIPLFLWQLTFLIVGTVYGKIKWPKPRLAIRLLCIAGVIVTTACMVAAFLASNWYLFSFHVIAFIYFVCEYRGIDWRRVWRAAQACHVRLCLGGELDEETRPDYYRWLYINFGYPTAQIDYWRTDQIDGKRFRYFDRTFDPSPVFIEKMIEYAEDQVGKGYDDLQLISNGLHLIAWIIYPPCWGKEIKVIKALNRKGGREHCTSGVTACLRWAEAAGHRLDVHRYFAKKLNILLDLNETKFFKGYHTAVVSPCLYDLSENWRK